MTHTGRPARSGRTRTEYTVASVGRALELLAAFERPPHEFGPSELARSLGMTKNQAFRLLRTLESRRFVERADDGAYRVGMRALEVGQLVVRRLDVVRAARPHLEELHARTGETVHLGVLDGHEAVCVDRIESRHLIRLSAEIGRRFPLHVGAVPKVLLAHLPPERQEEVIALGLPAYTRRTITDAAALRAKLADIRAKGYAVSDEDLDIGGSAVAAPIHDRSGAVVAAVSVAGPTPRVGRKLHTEHRALVVEAAARISASLGYVARARAVARR